MRLDDETRAALGYAVETTAPAARRVERLDVRTEDLGLTAPAEQPRRPLYPSNLALALTRAARGRVA